MPPRWSPASTPLRARLRTPQPHAGNDRAMIGGPGRHDDVRLRPLLADDRRVLDGDVLTAHQHVVDAIVVVFGVRGVAGWRPGKGGLLHFVGEYRAHSVREAVALDGAHGRVTNLERVQASGGGARRPIAVRRLVEVAEDER